MSDPMDTKSPLGAAGFWSGYTNANKSLQTFAAEMQKSAKQSMDQTTDLLEKLRGAKSLEEVVSIQTAFLQQSFSTYAETTRRLSEMMMAVPMEFARQGRSAFQQGTDAVAKAGEDLTKPHG